MQFRTTEFDAAKTTLILVGTRNDSAVSGAPMRVWRTLAVVAEMAEAIGVVLITGVVRQSKVGRQIQSTH